jgi:hypothetical protein
MSSGVFRTGADSYAISVKTHLARGGSTDSRRAAFAEAVEFCQKQGRDVLTTNEVAGPMTVDLTFRCLAPNDPAFKAPK